MFRGLEIEDFKEIVAIMEKTDNCKTTFRKGISGNLFIEGEGETELYLKAFPENSITISRVCFKNTRTGAMSKILEQLIIYCKKNNLKEIIIESALTKEMVSFANKHGFKPVEFTTFSYDGLLVGNYELLLDKANSGLSSLY